jgi:hypothetical protein
MKKFYKCPICGEEFCLKGKKYCTDGSSPLCSGREGIGHTQIKMEYVGSTIEELRQFRKSNKRERP